MDRETFHLERRRFTDITLMNWLRMDDHWFREINHESIFISADQGWASYYRAELFFREVEYMSCPAYLPNNIEWRMATRGEAETVLGRYVISDAEREHACHECHVYCMDEVLSVYSPASRPQRDPHTFYIVAHSLEILVYYGGNFDNLGLSRFQ